MSQEIILLKSILESINEQHNLLKEHKQDYLLGLVENIRQRRDLIKHFIIISSGIIGFTIPVFGRTDLIKNSTFLIFGLLELVIVILYGFFYLSRILDKENNNLKKRFEEGIKLLSNPSRDELLHQFLDNKTEENYNLYQAENQAGILRVIKQLNDYVEKNEKNKKKDYALDIIFSAFLSP